MLKPRKKEKRLTDNNEQMNDLGSDLCKAAFFGNLSFLEAMFSAEAVDIHNLRDLYGDTPLHRAVYSGQLKCVYFLLEHNVDVNARGAGGMTPLHSVADSLKCIEPNIKQGLTASRIQDLIIEVTSLLVARGAKLRMTDEKGRTPIDVARENKFTDLIEIMEGLRVDQDMQEQRIEHIRNMKILEEACLSGQVKLVEEMLDRIPSVIDECLPNDDPLIVAAARSGNVNLVQFLVSRGVSMLINPIKKETALHVAVRSGNKEMVVEFLKSLPQLLLCDDTGEETSLHIAAAEGNKEIAAIFLELVEQSGFFAKSLVGGDESGNVPLGTPNADSRDVQINEETDTSDPFSVEDLDVEIASRKIDPFHQTKRDRHTPLHLAVDNSHLGIIQLYYEFVSHLMEANSACGDKLIGRLELLNKRGLGAFHCAALKGNIPAMDLLLKMGVNINTRVIPALSLNSDTNYTALGIAGVAGKFEAVKFLLKHGAKDPGNKALHRTLKAQHMDCAGLMLWHNEYASILPNNKDPEIPVYDGRKPDFSVILSWGNRELKHIANAWLTLHSPERIPADKFASITSIELVSNNLSELPIELFKLPYLTRLDISKNQIEFLPTEGELGWECKGLFEFKLSYNAIRSLPEGIFALPNLTDIDAGHNNIASLPMAMWHAPKLKSLKLHYNRIVQLPFPNTQESFSSRTRTMSSSEGPVMYHMDSSPVSPGLQTRFTVDSLSQSYFKTPKKHTRKRADLVELKEGFNKRYGFLNDSEAIDTEEHIVAAELLNPLEDSGNVSCLETLNLQNNQLTMVPLGLCCLAPKLRRLIVSSNQIHNLGRINDFPVDLDTLDVQKNVITEAVRPSLGSKEISYMNIAGLPVSFCPSLYLLQGEKAYKYFGSSVCTHRTHRQLRKLSSYRLSFNKLTKLQIFMDPIHKPPSLSDMAGSEEKTTKETQSGKGNGGKKGTPPSSDTKQKLQTKRSSSSGRASSWEGEGQEDATDIMIVPLFPQLNTLEVASNQLSSLPKNIHLATHLGTLDISDNTRITSLPLEMGRLEQLFFFLHNNVPLKSPNPAIFDTFKDTPAKMFYMKTLLQDAQPNTSLKLMLVGFQKQGKTTLLSHLTEVNELQNIASTFTMRTTEDGHQKQVKQVSGEHLSTVGVDLGIWKYNIEKESTHRSVKGERKKSVTFYTWDFGGQEEYYATHQLFLSVRSLYLVIFNMTTGEKGIQELAPWLHNIEARAPRSPVIIIGTHLDHYRDPQEKKAQMEKYRARIRELYDETHTAGQFSRIDPGLPVIKGIMFVGLPSSKDSRDRKPEGVAELRKFIYKTAWELKSSSVNRVLSKQPLLEQPVPASYLKLEYRVREISTRCRADRTPPVIQENAFREAVKDVIEDKRELDQAVSFLHENGILLHYDTPALSHLYFVNPQWLCDMLAHVITVPEVNGWIGAQSGLKSGILKKSSLQQVFKGQVFPIQFQKEYIELLNRFEVAIQVDSSHLLVPSALSAKPMHTVSYQPTLFPRPTLQQILDSVTEAGNPDNQLYPHFTKLLLRRFYFMAHLPSGFWPRLTSRFLTDNAFFTIVLGGLGYDKSDIDQIIKNKNVTDLSWTYWKTGIELWCQNTSILRVTEILHEGALRHCLSTPSPLVVSSSEAIDPAKDSAYLLFDLQGQYHPVDISGAPRGLEIIVSDCISRKVLNAALQREKQSLNKESSQKLSSSSLYTSVNPTEDGWMGAQLLAYTVEVLDLLLEDWFPGIGSRDKSVNRYNIPYINRIVPCPFCVNQASPCPVPEEIGSSYERQDSLSTGKDSQTHKKKRGHFIRKKFKKHIRPLFGDSTDKEYTSTSSTQEETTNSVEVLDMEVQPPETYDSGTEHLEPSSPLTTEDIVMAQAQEGSFQQVNRFGFMVDYIITMSRQSSTVHCPMHKDQPLQIRDLAPDLVFADFQKHYLEESQVVFGSFVGNGSFGDIFQGTVLPFTGASDAQGFAVAIKICAAESPRKTKGQKDNAFQDDPMDTAVKTYSEVRAEASLLREMKHPYLIGFMGLCLKPLCIALEWAPKKSLKSIINSYKKSGARLSPQALQETAIQIASGLSYLHASNTTHFDMKADNVLVFKFPSAQYSLERTTPGATKLSTATTYTSPFRAQQLQDDDPDEILIKITDFGISRQSSLGYYKGQRGTSGFMAPEILKYSGKEAVHSKVDIYSYAMVLYEMISHYHPFEQEGLHQQQMDKLTIDKKRPVLGNKELNNPLLYLDMMMWCWQDDYNIRPNARILTDLLSLPTVPHLIEAFSLGPLERITCACVSSILIGPQQENSSFKESVFSFSGEFEESQKKQFMEATGSAPPGPPVLKHQNVAFGDMYQDLWLASHCPSKESATELHIVSFQGRTKHYVQSLRLCRAPVSAMCAVSGGVSKPSHVWVGTTHGELFVFEAVSRTLILDRHLAIKAETQGIVSIMHVPDLSAHAVVVIRKDGHILLFDDELSTHSLPDDSEFDHSHFGTLLPVKAVTKTRNSQSVHCATIRHAVGTKCEIICGCDSASVQLFVFNYSRIEYSTTISYGSFHMPSRTRSEESYVSHLVEGREGERDTFWGLVKPEGILMCWDGPGKQPIRQMRCKQFTQFNVESIQTVGSKVYLATSAGRIIAIDYTNNSWKHKELSGHYGDVNVIVPLGARTLPRHWLPSIIGRTSAKDKIRSELSDENVQKIEESIIGESKEVVVSVGKGFFGLGRENPLSSEADQRDSFLLLWT